MYAQLSLAGRKDYIPAYKYLHKKSELTESMNSVTKK